MPTWNALMQEFVKWTRAYEAVSEPKLTDQKQGSSAERARQLDEQARRLLDTMGGISGAYPPKPVEKDITSRVEELERRPLPKQQRLRE